MDTPTVIGISRAKILNSKNQEIPEVGKWFEPQNSQNLPTFMKSGTVTIGKAGKQGPLVRPSGPIQAQVYSRNTTKNLLETIVKIILSSQMVNWLVIPLTKCRWMS